MARGREGGPARLMRALAAQAGPFMALGFLGSATLGVLGGLLEGDGVASAANPIPFYVLAAVGVTMLLGAYLMGARDTEGERPTVATILGFWLYFSLVLIVYTSVYLRFELAFPGFLPRPPDELFFGVRNAAFFMLFQAGWGYFFGVRHGWIRMQANPAPLGWLFRKTSPGMDAEGEKDQDTAR